MHYGVIQPIWISKKERGITGTTHSGAPGHGSLNRLSNRPIIKLICCCFSQSQAWHTWWSTNQPEGPGNNRSLHLGWSRPLRANMMKFSTSLSDLASTSPWKRTETLRGSSHVFTRSQSVEDNVHLKEGLYSNWEEKQKKKKKEKIHIKSSKICRAWKPLDKIYTNIYIYRLS